MTELTRPPSGSASVVTGEVVSSDALAATAAEVAARQRSPETRRTYAAVYRTFCAGLAATVGAHADVRTVRSASVARGERRALSHDEFARLLRMPDRRTRQGKRDLALLHLLGSAGLRRSEAPSLGC